MVEKDWALLEQVSGRLQLKKYREPGPYEEKLGMGSSKATTPSEYFMQKYPSLAQTYGAPVLEHVIKTGSGLAFTGALALNEDFFSALIGGDPSLGHKVVFYVPEQQWYFLDVRHDFFVPTTGDKLMILLSQHLIHCAESLPAGFADIGALFIPLRNESALKSIIKRARAVLAADRSFFESPDGHKRRVGNGIVDPALEPPYKLFIHEVLAPDRSKILTLNDCYANYSTFCENRGFDLTERREFKGLVRDVIREEFGVALRNDLKNDQGRWTSGWKGIAPRQELITERN